MSALEDIRKLLNKHTIAAYIQPVHDEFLNEYAPACNRRVEWLTGFSGSAGSVAITQNKAALFTDGRYTLQAQNEVDAAVYEQHNSGATPAENWLADVLKEGDTVGYDARLFTHSMIYKMQQTLLKKAISLTPVPNLVDAIWKDRPSQPASPLFVHALAYAGQTVADKCAAIAYALTEKKADYALIAAPDAVCWLFNIRARDIENTPLLLSVALVDAQGQAELFVDPARVNEEIKAHLSKHVTLTPPDKIEARLVALGKANHTLLCDPNVVPVWFTQCLQQAGADIIEAQDPCLLAKACKNNVELQGIRNAHLRDGVAVAKLLCWLENEVTARQVMELEICDKLLALRAQQPLFLEPSFNTISGSGPNGAIVHYRASQASNRALQEGELFLLDSGGQYPDGTTDITRTVVIGSSTPEQRDRFTRVLKGHIALAMAKFPDGTAGGQLDALARQYLWQANLDYDHGTGHGVGCFLNVHEGPQRISKRGGDAALKPGMIVSNEPGYYKTGAYGIRIENLVAVIETHTDSNGRKWLCFDTLTCVPIDTRLVDVNLMTRTEREWLNAYHSWVLKELSQALSPQEKLWLERACAPI